MRFERVHRINVNEASDRDPQRPKNIVAKFTLYKDREIVRRAKSKLKGTEHYVYGQFPKEIADKRKSLIPKLRQAIREGKRAWLSYDTLYINGRPVKGDNQ
jgi:hypothetical protein